MKSLVAIVGRPNVGKSTLFNRLCGRRRAIVEDQPGVTRDRHYADTEWNDRGFTLIDTGGFVSGEKDALLKQVRQQALFAVQECDVILFVVDGQSGISSADETVSDELRRSGKPVIVIVNKLDVPKHQLEGRMNDFFGLGFEDVLPMSAEHGRGVDDVMDRVLALLPEEPAEPAAEAGAEGEEKVEPIRVAIIGRPNVGKSTLVNKLLKEERMVANETAGTTRDSIDAALTFRKREVILTDTAGIRRKKTIAQTVEQFAVFSALRSVERSHVAVLVMDATEPAVDQDAKIASVAEEKGRALIIVVNKWDKVAGQAREKEFREELKLQLKFVSYAPVIFTSALDGSKVEKVLEVALQLYDQHVFRAPTPTLNKLIKQVIDHHPLPHAGGKALRIYYMTQVTAAPPTFVLTCNRPKGIPERYKRYIVNQLRETFRLNVPVRLVFRERPGAEKRADRLNQMAAGKRHLKSDR